VALEDVEIQLGAVTPVLVMGVAAPAVLSLDALDLRALRPREVDRAAMQFTTYQGA
jgi:hypothetical protein